MDPLAAVNAELQRVQTQIDEIERKINEAETELKKPPHECELGRQYWIDEKKKLRGEKNKLHDKELLLLQQRTAPAAVSSATGQAEERERRRGE